MALALSGAFSFPALEQYVGLGWEDGVSVKIPHEKPVAAGHIEFFKYIPR
jgi:hypothetical protein